MTYSNMSPRAAALFDNFAPSLTRPERFLSQLRRMDPEREDLQRAIYKLFVLDRKAVDEDSPLVREIAELYSAGEFGERIESE